MTRHPYGQNSADAGMIASNICDIDSGNTADISSRLDRRLNRVEGMRLNSVRRAVIRALCFRSQVLRSGFDGGPCQRMKPSALVSSVDYLLINQMPSLDDYGSIVIQNRNSGDLAPGICGFLRGNGFH